MKILGISRGLKYSPNLAGNDAAIFTAVKDELKAMGHEVESIHESDMVGFDYTPYERVFSMARDIFSLFMLEKETDLTTQQKFVNSINGILTCTNKASVATHLLEAGVPQPEFLIGKQRDLLFCSAGQKENIILPLWLKNSDGSATVAEDTLYCSTKEEFNAAFKKMEEREVNLWLVQEHKAGDLIKFYGVEGTDFFQWNYASQGPSKFGLEKVNGKEKGYPVHADRIKYYADLIAKRIQVPIYGGDAIIDEQGEFWFIDFNDFPSFSSCREEAATAIAQRIIQ